MTRRTKRVLGITAGIVFGLFAVLILVLAFMDWNRLRGPIADVSRSRTGRALEIRGDLDVRLSFSPTIEMRDFTYENAPWAEGGPMLEGELFRAQIRLWPLLRGRLELPELTLQGTTLRLERSKEGQGNWALEGRQTEEAPAAEDGEPGRLPLVEALTVERFAATFHDHESGRRLGARVDELTSGAATRDEPVTLAGRGSVEEVPFEIGGRFGSLDALEAGGEYPAALTAELGDFVVFEAEGHVERPAAPEGALFAVKTEVQRLHEMLAAFDVAIGPMQPARFSGQVRYAPDRLSVEEIAATYGYTQTHGEAGVRLGERTRIEARLDVRRLHLDDFLTPVVERPDEPPADAPLFSEGPLPLAPLRMLDADVAVEVAQITSEGIVGALLTDASVALTLERGVLSVERLRLGTGGGSLETRGRLDASSDVAEARVELDVKGVGLGRMIERAELPEQVEGDLATQVAEFTENISGQVGSEVRLETRGASMKELAANLGGEIGVGIEEGTFSQFFMEAAGIDFAGALTQWIQGDNVIELRCFLAKLPVESGRITMNPLLLATEVSNIWGEGAVDLGEETLDVTLRVRPRDASIGVARTPFHIEGTLREPKAGIATEQLLARLGAAVGLGALINPLAAALAFIETGPGSEGVCSQYLDEVRALAH